MRDDLELRQRMRISGETVRDVGVQVLMVQENRHVDESVSSVDLVAQTAGLRVVVEDFNVHHGNSGNGIAVADDVRVQDVGVLRFESAGLLESTVPAVWALLSLPGNVNGLFVSAHFAWGGNAEGVRLRQAYAVDAFAETMNADLTVFGGDLNSVPAAASQRFLRGHDVSPNGESTVWVDAWEKAGVGHGYTSVPARNPWGVAAANTVGISEVSLLPDRRIDYVYVRGYAHGRLGCPLHAETVHTSPAGEWLSDHALLFADLWVPDVSE